MKVLMLGWELPPFNSGGLGEACLGLSKSLAKKGIDLTFVLPKSEDVHVDGVKIIFADVDEEFRELKSAYNSSQQWSQIFSKDEIPPDFVLGSFKYAKKIGKLVRKLKTDIIHSHDWLTYPAALASKSVLNKPLVAHVHSTEYDRTGGNFPNKTILSIEKRGLLVADKVLPVGGFMKDILINNYQVSSDKIEVVYNGLDTRYEKLMPPALTAFKRMGYKIVLFLGRITLQKGPEYFVKASERVLKYNPKTLFLVVGSGDMQDYMMSEAARLGVIDKYFFTGFLRGEERDKIIQAADLYVMPSVSEPFGIVALEAVANKTPVLVSKQTGVSEVLKNALKTNFWDIDDMTDKILSVLKYKPLSQDLKVESYKELDGLSWAKSADKVINVYKELL